MHVIKIIRNKKIFQSTNTNCLFLFVNTVKSENRAITLSDLGVNGHTSCGLCYNRLSNMNIRKCTVCMMYYM